MDNKVQVQAIEWLRAASLSQLAAARRAGLSQSTLHRVLNGAVDPTFGTLREIAFACGLELQLDARPASDPAAAAAARAMLEGGYPPVEDSQTAEWLDRLVRLAGAEDPVELVKAAAAMSAPTRREGGVFFAGQTTVGRVASAGDASRADWALSGAVGLALPEFGDPLPGLSILWCAEADAVVHNLADSDLARTHRPDRATLAVLHAEPQLFTNRFEQKRVGYVAPIQIMIDCLSLGGSVAEDALAEVMSW